MLAIMLATMVGSETLPILFEHRPVGEASAVTVVGRFNGWNVARNRLERGEDGVWRTTLPIEPGVYEYWFLEDFRVRVESGKGPRLVVPPRSFAERPGAIGDGIVTVSALRHSPGRRDAIRWNERTWVFRLRARAGDVESVAVKVAAREWPMRRIARDELFETWQGRAEADGPAIRYSFVVRDGDTEVRCPEGGEEFLVSEADFPLAEPPDWVPRSVFYQVFPDRFANGDPSNDPAGTQPWGSTDDLRGFFGGDLAGLSRRLAHLRDLGVSGLLLNPVFTSQTYHRYDPTDPLAIDPGIGTGRDFDDLVLRLRAIGVRLVLDGVFNHTSTDFFAFRDLREREADSAFRDWYTVHRFPIDTQRGQQTYEGWFGHAGLPQLRTDNPDVQAYLTKVALHWVRDRGASGWRLDAADEVHPSFWQSLRRELKKAAPDAWILGEVWGDAHEWLQGDMWDSAMNYPWRGVALDLFVHRSVGPAEADARLAALRESIPERVGPAMLNLLGSHDTPRLRTLAKGDPDRIRQAMAFQFAYPGVPILYYGDEVGMEGEGDPDCRRCMDWTEKSWDRPLMFFVRDLVALRRAYPVLSKGDYATAVADDQAGTFVFVRRSSGQVALAAFNVGRRPAKWEAPMQSDGLQAALLHKGSGRIDPLPGEKGTPRHDRLAVTLEPGGCAIFVFRPAPGRDVLAELAPPRRSGRGPSRPRSTHPFDP